MGICGPGQLGWVCDCSTFGILLAVCDGLDVPVVQQLKCTLVLSWLFVRPCRE
jgi:hypothetical protein